MQAQPQPVHVRKVVSGGQTGVDRAALDVAIELGFEHGGWCPRGRLAEDVPIPPRYQLRETASSEYPVRTEQNVLDSDATLILCRGRPEGGTELTLRMASRHGKPCLVVDLDDPLPLPEIRQWLAEHQVSTINVAGPRESQNPGIGRSAADLLRRILADRGSAPRP